MDAIKNISFSIALVLIGAVFILISVSGGVFFDNNVRLVIDQEWAKNILLIFGVCMVGVAIFLEVRSKSTRSPLETQISVARKPTSPRTTAEDFFYTLDQKGVESFPEMIKDAVSIKIIARTIVNLLNRYERELEQIGKTGCELKILLVNPESEIAKSLYGIDPEVFFNNATITARHLERLRKSIGTGLQTKIINKAPTLSMVIIEKIDATKGFIQIQFYFLHSAIGFDRPIFNIAFGDKWFRMFEDEFSRLWIEGVDWDTNTFLHKNAGQEK